MNVTGTFLPIAQELIGVFATPIVYIRSLGASYDPATGEVVETTEQFNINAGIEEITLTEEGGTAETRQIKFWIDHGPTGVPHEPSTADRIEYKGRRWKVTQLAPEFASVGDIASCVIARAD